MADIPDGERAVLDALIDVCDTDLLAAPSAIATRMGVDVTQIAAAGSRLGRRAIIERRPDGWHIIHRLAHRYLTTGTI